MAAEEKELAKGRWAQILASLAPRLSKALERPGRHVPCPVHGGRDGFRVFKDVEETGGSVCNTCGVFPDGFATLMWVNAWNFKEALQAVADFLQAKSWRSPHPRTNFDVEDEAKEEEIRQTLKRVWQEAVGIEDREAEPARLYLARRGLSISPPRSLKFHPSLPYYDDGKKIGEFPAILAPVTGIDGRPVTIFRTYLTSDGKKAPVGSPKKMMRLCDVKSCK
jgi:putative DNA primase/helicase